MWLLPYFSCSCFPTPSVSLVLFSEFYHIVLIERAHTPVLIFYLFLYSWCSFLFFFFFNLPSFVLSLSLFVLLDVVVVFFIYIHTNVRVRTFHCITLLAIELGMKRLAHPLKTLSPNTSVSVDHYEQESSTTICYLKGQVRLDLVFSCLVRLCSSDVLLLLTLSSGFPWVMTSTSKSNSIWIT